MKEMLVILSVLFIILVAAVAVLVSKVDLLERKADIHTADLGRLAARADALERRADWLAEDTDNRLARRKMNIQMLQMRTNAVTKRIRRCEKELNINIKEIEENGYE